MKIVKKTLSAQSCFFLIVALLFQYSVASAEVNMSKSTFTELPHWDHDSHSDAFHAFVQSCAEIVKRKPDLPFSTTAVTSELPNRAWQRICVDALAEKNMDDKKAKLFFETHFEPVHISKNGEAQGQFTGYYLPLIHGSLTKTGPYQIPVHAVPNDLVKIDLGATDPKKAGQVLVRQKKDNQLVQYPDRRTILADKKLNESHVLVWADNIADVFFAQVQGSCLIEFPNKEHMLIGYGAKNGHPYTSIGKLLIERKELTKENVSMQTIRQWLIDHLDQAEELLNQNASYVFFQKLMGENPLGTEQVPLTPRRSLAVDPSVIPLGAPIWLSTEVPHPNTAKTLTPFQHLLIAQDTGGAIKGAVRGDVYWGPGEDAAYTAGYMNSKGEYWLLVPKTELH